MKTHELKTWPSCFAGIRDGTKTFELRKNDRAFDVGDLLVLREWQPVGESYTGELELRRVSSILTSTQFGGLQPGFVIMGIKPVGDGPMGIALRRLADLATKEGWNTPIFAVEYAKALRAARAALGDEATRETLTKPPAGA